MSKKIKFPETLYVAKEEPETENEWLNASESIRLLASVRDTRFVAVYKLVEVKKVSLEIHEEMAVESAA